MSIQSEVIRLMVEADPTQVGNLTNALQATDAAVQKLQADLKAGSISAKDFETKCLGLVTIQHDLQNKLNAAKGGIANFNRELVAGQWAFQDFVSTSGDLGQKLNSITNNLPALLGKFGQLGTILSGLGVLTVAVYRNWDALMSIFGDGTKLGQVVGDLGTWETSLKAAKKELEALAESYDKSGTAMLTYQTKLQALTAEEERLQRAQEARKAFQDQQKESGDTDAKERAKELRANLTGDKLGQVTNDLAASLGTRQGLDTQEKKANDELAALLARPDKGILKDENGMPFLDMTTLPKEKLKKLQAQRAQVRRQAETMIGAELGGENTGMLEMLPEGSKSRQIVQDAYDLVDKRIEDDQKENEKRTEKTKQKREQAEKKAERDAEHERKKKEEDYKRRVREAVSKHSGFGLSIESDLLSKSLTAKGPGDIANKTPESVYETLRQAGVPDELINDVGDDLFTAARGKVIDAAQGRQAEFKESFPVAIQRLLEKTRAEKAAAAAADKALKEAAKAEKDAAKNKKKDTKELDESIKPFHEEGLGLIAQIANLQAEDTDANSFLPAKGREQLAKAHKQQGSAILSAFIRDRMKAAGMSDDDIKKKGPEVFDRLMDQYKEVFSKNRASGMTVSQANIQMMQEFLKDQKKQGDELMWMQNQLARIAREQNKNKNRRAAQHGVGR